MRKITPVLESELSKLPAGWRWVDLLSGRWMAVIESDEVVEVDINEQGIMIGHGDRYDPAPVPFEVISAVLKANGVEL